MPYFFDLDQRTGGAFVFSICRFRHPTGQGPLLLLTYSDIFKHISRKTWRVMRRCEFDLINVFERHLGNLGVRCFFWLEECGNGGVTRNFCILGAYVTWLWIGSLKRYEEIGALLWNFSNFFRVLILQMIEQFWTSAYSRLAWCSWCAILLICSSPFQSRVHEISNFLGQLKPLLGKLSLLKLLKQFESPCNHVSWIRGGHFGCLLV